MKFTHQTTPPIEKSWQHKRDTIGEIVTDADDVAQCYRTIMSTQKGSIPFAPEIGCDLLQAVGETALDSIRMLTAVYMKELPLQEPRANLHKVTGDYDENGKICMKAYYTTKDNNKRGTAEVVI